MESRLAKTAKNTAVALALQALTIFSRFFAQTIFIHTLGSTFLGLNGLFNNVLQVLSFAELGLGTAIVYFMYQPLANDDHIKIAAYMNFYRKAYNVIGFVVFGLGMLILPFLPMLVNDKMETMYYIYFIVFLVNSASSYFFSYKRNLLNADQKGFISGINNIAYMLAQTVLQIIILIFFHSFMGYLIIAFVCMLLSNIQISRKVDKMYPYLIENKSAKLTSKELKHIIDNTKEIIGAKVGSIVVTSTDNIVLSTFVGLSIVGVYSNYLLLISSVTRILQSFSTSVVASVGNLVTEHDSKKSVLFFNHILFINFTLGLLTSTMFYVIVNPFVQIWAGKGYLITNFIVLFIALQLAIQQLRETNGIYMGALGTYKHQGIKSIILAVVNLGLSVAFVVIFHLGILGVTLGTIISYIISDLWFDVRQDIKNGLKLPWKKLALKEYLYVFIYVMVLIIIYYINLINIGLMSVPLRIALVALMDLIVLMMWYRSVEFKYVSSLLKKIIGRDR
ncbi:MAG: transporter [Lactobacillaceae bacterium]|nr:transporter [Lactobacillaceae bacterium]